MSPSEFELRDALRHGEGDAIDVSAIIAKGEHIRRERRVRYLTTAAAVVVVAGVTSGIVIGTSGGSSDRTSVAGGKNADQSSVEYGTGAGGSGTLGTNGGSVPQAASSLCAQTPPAIGVPTAADRSRSFFTKTVSSFLACAYPKSNVNSVVQPVSATEITGADAQTLAASLDDAPTVRTVVPCPLQPVQITLTLRPMYADGQPGPLILTSDVPVCALPTTNGAVVRYGWQPPSVLDAFLDEVRVRALAAAQTVQPTGKGFPSPTNS